MIRTVATCNDSQDTFACGTLGAVID